MNPNGSPKKNEVSLERFGSRYTVKSSASIMFNVGSIVEDEEPEMEEEDEDNKPFIQKAEVSAPSKVRKMFMPAILEESETPDEHSSDTCFFGEMTGSSSAGAHDNNKEDEDIFEKENMGESSGADSDKIATTGLGNEPQTAKAD